MSTELATVQQTPQQKAPILANERGVQFHSLSEMWKFAELAANSGIYKGMTPHTAIITIQAGAELGLSPVWSLTNILVVNGRPSVWGDALLGIVLAHPDCEDVIETSEGAGENYTAICEVRRKGRTPVVRKFGVADAKRAGLTGKGVHANYPQRMLQMRARAFACRDAFADALRGLGSREEMESVEPRRVEARVVSSDFTLPEPEPQPAAKPEQKEGELL
jgi:hypothetical protein